jgi:hypothetical protein
MKRPNRVIKLLQDVEIVQLGDQERGVYAVVVLFISLRLLSRWTAYDASALICKVTT